MSPRIRSARFLARTLPLVACLLALNFHFTPAASAQPSPCLGCSQPPDCANCITTSFHSCSEACRAAQGDSAQEGICNWPASTSFGQCCACARKDKCSKCLGPFHSCSEACSTTFGVSVEGICAVPDSTDLAHCCQCHVWPNPANKLVIGHIECAANGPFTGCTGPSVGGACSFYAESSSTNGGTCVSDWDKRCGSSETCSCRCVANAPLTQACDCPIITAPSLPPPGDPSPTELQSKNPNAVAAGQVPPKGGCAGCALGQNELGSELQWSVVMLLLLLRAVRAKRIERPAQGS
jgi:hypothetical protein